MLIQDTNLLNHPPRHLQLPNTTEREALACLTADRQRRSSRLLAQVRAHAVRFVAAIRPAFSSRA